MDFHAREATLVSVNEIGCTLNYLPPNGLLHKPRVNSRMCAHNRFSSNRVHVVFGRVVDGEEVVRNIESIPVNEMSRPIQDVKIVNCGQLVLKSKREFYSSRRSYIIIFRRLNWQ